MSKRLCMHVQRTTWWTHSEFLETALSSVGTHEGPHDVTLFVLHWNNEDWLTFLEEGYFNKKGRPREKVAANTAYW